MKMGPRLFTTWVILMQKVCHQPPQCPPPIIYNSWYTGPAIPLLYWTGLVSVTSRTWQTRSSVPSFTQVVGAPTLACLDHLLWRKQLLCPEDSQAALWRGPWGMELRSPNSRHRLTSHLSEPPGKQVL